MGYVMMLCRGRCQGRAAENNRSEKRNLWLAEEPLEVGHGAPLLLGPFRPPGYSRLPALPGTVAPLRPALPVGN